MDYFTVGEIVNTHGIKGEVKIYPQADDISEITEQSILFIEQRGEIKEYDVVSAREHKGMALVKLKGIDDMTAAERLKGSKVKITREMAAPCEDDEYFVKDLYGMEVVTDEGEVLGELYDILFTGANDVYIVKTQGNDILIPAIKQCILKVDVAANRMTVKLLEGLRE